MISDAFVIFTCDSCGIDEEVKPPVVYSSMSGTDPHIDLRDRELNKAMPRGWKIIDEKHLCEDCSVHD